MKHVLAAAFLCASPAAIHASEPPSLADAFSESHELVEMDAAQNRLARRFPADIVHDGRMLKVRLDDGSFASFRDTFDYESSWRYRCVYFSSGGGFYIVFGTSGYEDESILVSRRSGNIDRGLPALLKLSPDGKALAGTRDSETEEFVIYERLDGTPSISKVPVERIFLERFAWKDESIIHVIGRPVPLPKGRLSPVLSFDIRKASGEWRVQNEIRYPAPLK